MQFKCKVCTAQTKEDGVCAHEDADWHKEIVDCINKRSRAHPETGRLIRAATKLALAEVR